MKKSAKALEYGGYAFALILAITIRLTGASAWWIAGVVVFIFAWGGYFRKLSGDRKKARETEKTDPRIVHSTQSSPRHVDVTQRVGKNTLQKRRFPATWT